MPDVLEESARRILVDVDGDKRLFRGAMMQFLRYNHHYLWVLMKWDKFGPIDGLYNNLSGKDGKPKKRKN